MIELYATKIFILKIEEKNVEKYIVQNKIICFVLNMYIKIFVWYHVLFFHMPFLNVLYDWIQRMVYDNGNVHVQTHYLNLTFYQ